MCWSVAYTWGIHAYQTGKWVMDRATKTFIAVFTLVAAIMLAVNHAIDKAPIADWWLAGLLLVISAAFWVWLWLDSQTETTALAVAEKPTSTIQEWIISKEAAVAIDKTETAMKAAVARAMDEAAHDVAQPLETKTKPAAQTAEADEPDDLERIEGIGPKYRDALYAQGITKFDQIAAMTVQQIAEVIQKAGMRRAASIDTWADQAKYAADGDWEGLNQFQARLKGGRREEG